MRIIDALGSIGLDDDEFVQTVQTAYVEKLTTMVEKVNLSSGSRTTYDAEPADVVLFDDDDDTTITATYKGNNVTAVLHADNTVTLDGTTYPSVSAAAGAVCARPQNGWTFWRYNGDTLASLRDAR